MNTTCTIVIDNGSGMIKCGFAGEEFPIQFPCVVGRRQSGGFGCSSSVSVEEIVVGGECLNNDQLQRTWPVSDGVVQNWEDMERVWYHAFHDQLSIQPSDCKVLLTQPTCTPWAHTKRSLEELFQKHGCAAVSIQKQAPLTLFAHGLVSGLVLESGEALTHAVPVVEGVVFPHAIKRVGVAGRQVTDYLIELLQRRGYSLSKSNCTRDVVQALKEESCFVPLDVQREKKLARETTFLNTSYTLPDGNVVRVSQERFLAPESLFTPSLVNVEGPGIAEMTFNAIQEMDTDNRRCLYEHIVLSGGNTMFPGLQNRLKKEIQQLYSDQILMGDTQGLVRLGLRVFDPPHRKHLVFQGGAVLADIMKDQEGFWITREEYEECPLRALQRVEFV